MKYWLAAIAFLIIAACNQGPAAQEQKEDTVARVIDTPAVTILTEKDTISIRGTLYNITDISQDEFDAIPGYEPSAISEEKNITPFAGKVSRNGKTLSLKLDNDSLKLFENNDSDGEDYAEYTFLDHIPALNAYLLQLIGYEYYSYVLVSTKDTGTITYTIGFPQLSPDKTTFLCSNSDMEAGFTTNGFELYEIKDGKFEKTDECFPSEWGPKIIKWKDAKTLLAHFDQLKTEEEQKAADNSGTLKERYVKLMPRK